MRQVAAQLTAADILNLTAWLASLPASARNLPPG
jgi:cytochrome c553